MGYYLNPEFLHQKLSYDSTTKLYDSMKNDDLAELPLTALQILISTDAFPEFVKVQKTAEMSIKFRDEGNKFYRIPIYWNALENYNKALLHAPKKSQEMILAYSNRSALLFRIKAYGASLKDIETCFNLGCSNELSEKLMKRKRDCQNLLLRDKLMYEMIPDDYFSIDGKRHPQIPCATTDVAVVIDSETELPKVVAANDIKVGTVVSVETTFVNLMNPVNHYLSCYQCHKMALNLIPCDGCCEALFCNDKCKNICMKESHRVECQIIELLNCNGYGPYSRITLRAVIKMKLMCDSWKEIIDASYNMGDERMRMSPISEIYNRDYKFSLLNFIETREIKIASIYNYGTMCATQLHYLNQVPSFYPKAPAEKREAMRGLARLMMGFFLLFHNMVEIINVADEKLSQDIKYITPNYGYLSFTSKLRHKCDANLLPIGLNNQVALVALHYIKKGAELTISYV